MPRAPARGRMVHRPSLAPANASRPDNRRPAGNRHHPGNRRPQRHVTPFWNVPRPLRFRDADNAGLRNQFGERAQEGLGDGISLAIAAVSARVESVLLGVGQGARPVRRARNGALPGAVLRIAQASKILPGPTDPGGDRVAHADAVVRIMRLCDDDLVRVPCAVRVCS